MQFCYLIGRVLRCMNEDDAMEGFYLGLLDSQCTKPGARFYLASIAHIL